MSESLRDSACRSTTSASVLIRAVLRLCRFKPCSLPNKKADPVGVGFNSGSGGMICSVPTVPSRVQVK